MNTACKTTTFVLVLLVANPLLATDFVRTDANADGAVNIADPVFTLGYLFAGGVAPTCNDAADANDDGSLNISDPTFTLIFLFSGGVAPPAPYPDCGADPTNDDVDCASFERCDTAPPCDVPSLEPIGDRTARAGQPFEMRLVASGDRADEAIFAVEPLPLPRRARFDADTGVFTFTPEASQIGSFDLTFSARYSECGRSSERITIDVRGSDSGRTTLAGIVLTTDAEPLPGVTLEVAGIRDVSGVDGTFFLDNLPAGRQRLLIDGSTVDSARGVFATVPEVVPIEPGADNVLDAPIYLLPLDVASADPIRQAADSVVTSSPIEQDGEVFPPVTMTVFAGSAFDEFTGDSYTGNVHISRIPSPELGPRPLPPDMELSVYIAVQPFGVKYDPPAEIAFPNVERFPVGAIVDIFGLDHDTGRMVKVGEGQVAADGMVHSIGGVVVANSWHGFVPQPPISGPPGAPPECESECKDVPAGSTVDIASGDLEIGHNTPQWRSVGAWRDLRLEYHSSTACPMPIIGQQITTGNLTPPPIFMRAIASIGGVAGGELVTDGPPFCPNNCPFVRQSLAVDATSVPTGIYPSSVTVDCVFPVSRRSRTFERDVKIVNRRNSPFGAGWSLQGLERLHVDRTGRILITRHDSFTRSYTPAYRARSIVLNAGERDLYQFAGSAGTRVSIYMNRRSPTLDPVLELHTSAGVLVAHDDDSGLELPAGPGRNARITSFDLPATDLYTVVARGRHATRGAYDLWLVSSEPSPLLGSGIIGEQPLSAAFEFTGELTAIGEQGQHVFAAERGTRVTIDVVRTANREDGSSTLNPQVALVNSDGIVMAFDEDGGNDVPAGPGANARIVNFPLPASDEFTIVVRGGVTVGTYDVTLRVGTPVGEVVTDSGGVTAGPGHMSEDGDLSTLELHRDGTWLRRLGSGKIHLFDSEGRQTAHVDRNGNHISYAYDEDDRLTSVTDPAGLTATLSYAAGLLTSIQDPVGRETTFEHDDRGNLIRIVNPDGTARTFRYDERHLLIGQRDRRGFDTRYEYDFSGRFVRSELPGGITREVLSDASAGLVNPAEGGGTIDNPAPPALERELIPTHTGADGRVATFVGDERGVASVTNAAGLTLSYERDPLGRPTRAVLPGGSSYSVTYDNNGGRRVVTNDVTQSSWSASFDSSGAISEVTSPEGDRRSIERDDEGNARVIRSFEGRTIEVEYDERGLITTLRWTNGLETHFTYDEAGRLIERVDGVGGEERATTYERSPAGHIVRIVDAEDREWGYDYDDLGRIVRVTFPDDAEANYSFDASGNWTSVTPPEGATTRFEYDARGFLTRWIAPAEGGEDRVTEFERDAEGHVLGLLRPSGQEAMWQLEEGGLLAQVNLRDGEVDESITVERERISRLPSAYTTASGERLALQRQRSFTRELRWTGSVAATLSFTFDTSGRIATVAVDGNSISYERDRDGLYTKAGDLVITRNVETGRFAEIALVAARCEFGYDEFLDFDSIQASFHGETIWESFYSRDRLGRIVEQREVTDLGETTWRYEYDARGHLRRVTADGDEVRSYAYDPRGNRIRVTTSGDTVAATYDVEDRLLSTGDTTYAYTADGIVESKTDDTGVTRYTYDGRGALRVVELPDGRRVEYTIDAAGRRIAKSIDGERVAAWIHQDRYNVVAEYTPNGSLQSRFVYATHRASPSYMVRADRKFLFVRDHLGSVRTVVDAESGEVAQRLDYDAFGNVTRDTNPGFQPFGWIGGHYDPDTKLLRLGARDYDPSAGRWLAKDPAGYAGGDLNLYRYAANDPVNLNDTTGHDITTSTWYDEDGNQLPYRPDGLIPITPDTDPDGFDAGVKEIFPGRGPLPPDPNDPFDPQHGVFGGRRSDAYVHEDGTYYPLDDWRRRQEGTDKAPAGGNSSGAGSGGRGEGGAPNGGNPDGNGGGADGRGRHEGQNGRDGSDDGLGRPEGDFECPDCIPVYVNGRMIGCI